MITDESNELNNNNRNQPSRLVRRFFSVRKIPLSTLLLSCLTGLLTGFAATAFQLIIGWLTQYRVNSFDVTVQNFFFISVLSFLISFVLAYFSYWLVFKFAPEASGSGIPEIEGALDDIRPVRWWRVLPVKFLGGIAALGSGMVLGREGPTVQIGGNIGCMLFDLFRLKDKDVRHALIASGSAGGLAAAFNAPLAGIMFVIEEMRPQFRYSFISIKGVTISVVVAVIVLNYFRGPSAEIIIPDNITPPVQSLWLFLLLGCLFGVFGVFFNKFVTLFQNFFSSLQNKYPKYYMYIVSTMGGCFGIFLFYFPEITGGGIEIIPSLTSGIHGIAFLFILFALRLIVTLLCFGSGAPGGIFAPMLALGTLFGMCFGIVAVYLFPTFNLSPSVFAIAGMGALFAATVRAPMTGVLLVIELTHHYNIILPLIITTLGATMLAQALGGKPIYSMLLKRKMEQEKERQSST